MCIMPVVLQAQSSSKEIWSLEQCINYAISHNITIKQKELSVQLSKENLFQSKMSLLPSLNGDASGGYNFGRSIDPTSNQYVSQKIQTTSLSVSSGITLFDGFKKINTIKENQYDLMANKFDTQQTKNDISLNITSAYLQILMSKEQTVITQNQVEISRQQLDQTDKSYKAGAIAEGSLLEMQAQLARDEVNLVTAKNQEETAYLNLILLLELDKNIELEKPNILVPSDVQLNENVLNKTYNEAVGNQPGIKSAEYRLKYAEKTLAVARGNISPSMSLFASLRTNYSDAYQRYKGIQPTGLDTIGYVYPIFAPVVHQGYKTEFEKYPFRRQLDDNFSQSIGLSLTIPIFNNWQTNNAIARAKINLTNTEYNYELVKKQLRKDIQQAYANAKAASQKYEASLKNIDAQKKTFHYVEEKSKVGLVNILEYTTAKSNFARAESDLLQAKYDYLFNLKILDFYQGKPIKL